MKFKKFLKLTKIRRFIILGITIVSAILAVTLGGALSVAKDPKKGIEYGGGAEYLIKVNPTDPNEDAQTLAASVGEAISDRIDALGVGGATVSPENAGDKQANVRVTYPGLKSKQQQEEMEKTIVEQPTLTMTDIYGNPLFDINGRFNQRLASKPNKFVGVGNFNSIGDFAPGKDGKPVVFSKVPIAENGASWSTTSTGEHQVVIKLKNNKEATSAWTAATSYIASLDDGQKQVIAWLDYGKFIGIGMNDYPTEWAQAQANPFMFAHIGNKATGTDKKANLLKYRTVNAKKYMISNAQVKQALSGTSFVISGSFTQAETQDLAKLINFGVAQYSLKTLMSRTIDATYGSNAFEKAMIAGLVVFAMVSIFLIANYGLLGVLSTISLALYLYLVLQLFTVMRGEYSPETIAALIIGIGMGVDANIITYERLKSEVYNGVSVKKGFSKSNKRSFTTIFDANITTLIVAFVLFYFGTKSIVGLSVTLILSIVFTLIIMLGFTRFMATMMINTGMFESRKHLLGVHSKFDQAVQKKINNFDYIKNAKWFVTGSAIIFGIALIVMAITAGVAHDIQGGFVASQDFTGGTIISTGVGHTSDVAAAQAQLVTMGVPAGDMHAVAAGTVNGIDATGAAIKIPVSTLDVNTTVVLDVDSLKAMGNIFGKSIFPDLNISNTTTTVADKLVRDALYAILIAMALIIVYTLIRFKWTFSLAAIVALVHDGLMVTAVFVICRVELSPVFVAGLLSILGYSINDTIVTFDRIREKLNNSAGEMTPAKVKSIANEAIKDTLKRSILTSLTTILAVIILMCFGNATKLSFNLAMLVGLLAGTYSSIFIASYLWVFLENFRQRRIKVREKKQFWKTKGVEEQTFPGINDFNA